MVNLHVRMPINMVKPGRLLLVVDKGDVSSNEAPHIRTSGNPWLVRGHSGFILLQARNLQCFEQHRKFEDS